VAVRVYLAQLAAQLRATELAKSRGLGCFRKLNRPPTTTCADDALSGSTRILSKSSEPRRPSHSGQTVIVVSTRSHVLLADLLVWRRGASFSDVHLEPKGCVFIL
jgi:hypothetical protein